MKKLNFGCGKRPRKDCVNLDLLKLPHVDVIHDINDFPYPFPDNTFDVIYCFQILEYGEDLIKIMGELWRISKPGAIIEIETPYFASSGAFSNPGRKSFITGKTFDTFLPGNFNNFNTKARVKILKRKLRLTRKNWLINKIPEYLVNIKFLFWGYERFFCFIFPFQEIYYKLKIIKSER